MRHLNTCITICCLLLASGCSNVVSKDPIGEEVYTPSAEMLNGIWYSNDEFIKIKVVDEINGSVRLAWIEEDDKDFKLESVTCTIMKGNDGLYLNVLDHSDKWLTGYYFWGKLKIEDDKILFWLPSFDAFKEAATSNTVKAIVEKTKPDKAGKQRITEIKLVDEPRVILELINKNSWKYFDYEDPIVLLKVSD